MSKTYEPRSLLKKEPVPIILNEEILESYIQWQKLYEERIGHKGDELDAFFAGWILSNPMVRDSFKILRKNDKSIEELKSEIRR